MTTPQLDLFAAAEAICGRVDRNPAIGEGTIATCHESAQTMAHGGSAGGVSSQPLPSFGQMYDFLREHYLNSRFEGRNGGWPKGCPEGGTYSEVVTRSSLSYLAEHGIGWITMYESRLGTAIKYDRTLTILNPDEPPGQIQRQAGHLTHIYGA